MRMGQYFRLKAATLAVDNSDGKPTTVDVPAGATICATGVRNPDNPQMIEVQWQDCRLFMFAVDVRERGGKIMGTTESPSSVMRAGRS